MSIRNARYSLQKNLTLNSGGRGRKKKLLKVNDFGRREKNFCDTYIHKISRELINYCLKYGVGKIRIIIDKEKMESLPEDQKKLCISSWSYYSINEKIKYKAKVQCIEIEEIEIKEGASVRPEAEASNALGNTIQNKLVVEDTV